MVTIETSEARLADYLRSARSTTQEQVDEATRQHDAEDIPAAVRWSAMTH